MHSVFMLVHIWYVGEVIITVYTNSFPASSGRMHHSQMQELFEGLLNFKRNPLACSIIFSPYDEIAVTS